MAVEPSDLDFAYKYPFSSEAKRVVLEIESRQNKVEAKYVAAGKMRVEEDIGNRNLEFRETGLEELKITYVISYVYARMIVSVLGIRAINMFVEAEAKRASEALGNEKENIIIKLASELGLDLRFNGQYFNMPFASYADNAPKNAEYSLIHQRLRDGTVYLEKYKTIAVIENASKALIRKGLPIEKKELPKEVIDAAKLVKIPIENGRTEIGGSNRYFWIERLLAHPLPDFRHRVVNLILAPYFSNIRNLSEEEAVKVISNYIDRCKELNPDTKVSEPYIRYQVKYAKEKGMKPLSLVKAKELLSDLIDFDNMM
ncbi:MAG: DNA primase noncatalytic subunit PriX [Candidatus Micrarchaeia archaeon]